MSRDEKTGNGAGDRDVPGGSTAEDALEREIEGPVRDQEADAARDGDAEAESEETEAASRRVPEMRSAETTREGALLAIARALNASLELETALERVLNLTGRALRASAVSVFIPRVRDEREQLVGSYVHEEGELQSETVSSSLGISGEVLESGRSFVIEDVRREDRFQGKLDALIGTSTRSLLAVPLRRRNRVIGLMEAVREIEEPFTAEDEEYLTAVADEVAVTVENSALLERLRRELMERKILLDVSREVGRFLELQEVLGHVLDSLSEVLPYDAGGIFLVDDDSGALRTWIHRGYPDGVDHLLDERPGGGIIRRVVETRRGVVVDRVDEEPSYIEARPSTESEIAAPIVSGGEAIGAINLESDRPGAYTERDLHLFELIAAQVSSAIVKARLHQRSLEQTQLEHELTLAREIQVGLFPTGPYPGPDLEVRGINVASHTVGGDYYDYFSECEQHAGLAIADVSGHGFHAALPMATMRAGVRLEFTDCAPPDRAMRALNRLLHAGSPANQYVTAFLGLLNLHSGRLQYCSAGHNPQLHLTRSGSEWLPSGGLPLGAFDDSEYATREVELAPTDLLVFFTDGLVEAVDGSGEEFGTGRLEETLRETIDRTADEIIEAVGEAVREHVGDAGIRDDITLMIARWCGDRSRTGPSRVR